MSNPIRDLIPNDLVSRLQISGVVTGQPMMIDADEAKRLFHLVATLVIYAATQRLPEDLVATLRQ